MADYDPIVIDDDDDEVNQLLDDVVRSNPPPVNAYRQAFHKLPRGVSLNRSPHSNPERVPGSSRPDWLRPSASFPKPAARPHALHNGGRMPAMGGIESRPPAAFPKPAARPHTPHTGSTSTRPHGLNAGSSPVKAGIGLRPSAALPKPVHGLNASGSVATASSIPRNNPTTSSPSKRAAVREALLRDYADVAMIDLTDEDNGGNPSTPHASPRKPNVVNIEDTAPPKTSQADEADGSGLMTATLNAFGRMSLETFKGQPPFVSGALPWRNKNDAKGGITIVAWTDRRLAKEHSIETWIPRYELMFDLVGLHIDNEAVLDTIRDTNIASFRCQIWLKKGPSEFCLHTTRLELLPLDKIAFPSSPVSVLGTTIKALGTSGELGAVTLSVICDQFENSHSRPDSDGIGGAALLEACFELVDANGTIDPREGTHSHRAQLHNLPDRTTRDPFPAQLEAQLTWTRCALAEAYEQRNSLPRVIVKDSKKTTRPIKVTFRHEGKKWVKTLATWTCPLCFGLGRRNELGAMVLEEHMRRVHEGGNLMWRISEAESHIYLTTDLDEPLETIKRPSTPPDERRSVSAEIYDTRAPHDPGNEYASSLLLKRHNFGRLLAAFEETLQQGAHAFNWESRRPLMELLSGKASRNPERQALAVMWLAYMQREGLPPRGNSQATFLEFLQSQTHPSRIARED